MSAPVIRAQLTRAEMLSVFREECRETIDAAELLDDAKSRWLVRLTVTTLFRAVVHRVTV